MPTSRIPKSANNALYFLTPTIKNWYYIFDRHGRWQILADSIKHCQRHKGLQVYAYVFMLNHLHLIVGSPDVAGFLRDFKQYTSRKLIENIRRTEPLVLDLFRDEKMYERFGRGRETPSSAIIPSNGDLISSENESCYSFWKKDNQPQILENEKFTWQKLNYIHDNPVKKGYVLSAEHWRWSSANQYSEIRISAFE